MLKSRECGKHLAEEEGFMGVEVYGKRVCGGRRLPMKSTLAALRMLPYTPFSLSISLACTCDTRDS